MGYGRTNTASAQQQPMCQGVRFQTHQGCNAVERWGHASSAPFNQIVKIVWQQGVEAYCLQFSPFCYIPGDFGSCLMLWLLTLCQQAVQPIHVQDVLQLVLLLTVGAALALG